MGDDDKSQSEALKLTNKLMENFPDSKDLKSSLRKDIFMAAYQMFDEKEKKDKQRLEQIRSAFKNFLFNEELESLERLIKDYPILKKDTHLDMSCATRGAWKSVIYLAENGFPLNKETDVQNDTLFTYAINQNKTDVLKIMKKSNQYDLLSTNKLGRQPYNEILEYGKPETIELFKAEYEIDFEVILLSNPNLVTQKAVDNFFPYLKPTEWDNVLKKIKTYADTLEKQLISRPDEIEEYRVRANYIDELLKRDIIKQLL